MDPSEVQAKAILAAALIVRGAVEVPSMPSGRSQLPDDAGRRLRELTDYVYRLVTTGDLRDLAVTPGAARRVRRRANRRAGRIFVSTIRTAR